MKNYLWPYAIGFRSIRATVLEIFSDELASSRAQQLPAHEALDLHLTTCQIYICEDCYCRTKHLHNIKEHLNEKHSSDGDFFEIIHAKINLKDPETIDQDFHAKIDIC